MRRLAAMLVLAGCALTSRPAPLELRYFVPPLASAEPREVGVASPHLRLGRIEPASYLREEIVHRDSPIELVPYETLRWSDPPDVYVRRAVVRELFDVRRFEEAVAGDVPSLDVEVTAFDELRRGAGRAGLVELRYLLHDEHRVLARGTISVERPAAGSQIEGVVAAIASATDAAAGELAERIETALGR